MKRVLINDLLGWVLITTSISFERNEKKLALSGFDMKFYPNLIIAFVKDFMI